MICGGLSCFWLILIGFVSIGLDVIELICFGVDVCYCWVDCVDDWIRLNDDSDGVMMRVSTQSKHKQVFSLCSKDVKQTRYCPCQVINQWLIVSLIMIVIDSVVIAGKAISLDQYKDVGTLYPIDDDWFGLWED